MVINVTFDLWIDTKELLVTECLNDGDLGGIGTKLLNSHLQYGVQIDLFCRH